MCSPIKISLVLSFPKLSPNSFDALNAPRRPQEEFFSYPLCVSAYPSFSIRHSRGAQQPRKIGNTKYFLREPCNTMQDLLPTSAWQGLLLSQKNFILYLALGRIKNIIHHKPTSPRKYVHYPFLAHACDKSLTGFEENSVLFTLCVRAK